MGKTAEGPANFHTAMLGRGDDAVGSPHRAQISQFELLELILLLKLDKQFPVEHFEATVSRSAVPSPPLIASTVIQSMSALRSLESVLGWDCRWVQRFHPPLKRSGLESDPNERTKRRESTGSNREAQHLQQHCKHERQALQNTPI